MTVFLMLAMGVLMISICCYRERRCKRISDWAAATILRTPKESPQEPPDDLWYHPGHTWVRVHNDNLVTIGATALASNFVGDLAAVMPPREHSRLKQGQPAWTLSSRKGRRLTQVMPLDGKVLALNHALLTDPNQIQREPYDSGWILLVKPSNLERCLTSLLPATAARAWVDVLGTRLNARLASAPGIQAFVGGAWATGFGDELDDALWNDVRTGLFPGASPTDEHRNASMGLTVPT